MPLFRGKSIVVGDEVDVLDTSNDRIFQGFVRQIDGERIQAYITRFKSSIWFEDGETPRGRFILQGRHR